MLNTKALQACKVTIQNDLNTLNDLPYELANTIANIYYRYWDLTLDTINRATKNPGTWLPRHYDANPDPLRSAQAFSHEIAQLRTDIRIIPAAIENLRRIDNVRQKEMYDDAVRFILDNLKYDIHNVAKKNRIRRAIERFLHWNRINEIPNLIDILSG